MIKMFIIQRNVCMTRKIIFEQNKIHIAILVDIYLFLVVKKKRTASQRNESVTLIPRKRRNKYIKSRRFEKEGRGSSEKHGVIKLVPCLASSPWTDRFSDS